jgi:hypothetical protein
MMEGRERLLEKGEGGLRGIITKQIDELWELAAQRRELERHLMGLRRAQIESELADANRALDFFEAASHPEEPELEHRRKMAIEDVKSRIKELEDELAEQDST